MSNRHIKPVVKTIRVHASIHRAFDVFTAGIARWWNPHSTVNPTGARIADVVLEPHVGGRWFERGADGSECDWGTVLFWEPPVRLIVEWLAGPKVTTEVEVGFVEVAPGVTEVRLEHRKLENIGDDALVWMGRFDEGWTDLIERYRTTDF